MSKFCYLPILKQSFQCFYDESFKYKLDEINELLIITGETSSFI
ncbi:hypothetical protein FHW71_000598 [Enterobacter sp. Sphag1F]|nr:hypothetical protein [Enterobacter sp. Sphag1F]NYI12800.1 hypothetical protein [Enterobacter sp. Sphag71]